MSGGGVKLDILRTGDAANMLGPAKRIEWSVTMRGRVGKDVVEELSRIRSEPDWMRRLRLRALEMFERQPWPNWLPLEGNIDLESLVLRCLVVLP